jgi:hypothetical protein
MSRRLDTISEIQQNTIQNAPSREWRGLMDRFIHQANIEHYEKLLERTTDEAERQRILKLLEEERSKIPEKPKARRRA